MGLALRPTGKRDYQVVENGQRIGRIRYADERIPGIWMWHVQVHLPGPPAGSEATLDAAKAAFKAAWLAFKSRYTAEQIAAAFEAMNIRD